MDAVKTEKWLNKTDNKSPLLFCGPHSEETKLKIKSKALLRGSHSEEHKQKMRKPKPMGFGENLSIKLKNIKKTEEAKLNMRKPKKIIYNWINNGIENKKLRKGEVIPFGWKKGRIICWN